MAVSGAWSWLIGQSTIYLHPTDTESLAIGIWLFLLLFCVGAVVFCVCWGCPQNFEGTLIEDSSRPNRDRKYANHVIV